MFPRVEDSPGPPAPAVTIEDAGLMLAEAIQLAGTLEAAAVEYTKDSEPLARGLLTCGEACRMVSAVVGLVLTLYPQLAELDVLETTIRHAMTTGTTGGVH
jgi:hypothetical protein